MRIVSVISYPFLPATTGGEICTAALLHELSQNHEVTAFTVEPYQAGYEYQTGKTNMEYAMPFKPSRYANIFLVGRLRKLLKHKKPDWVLFEQPWFGWLLWVLRLTTSYKFAIRSHNMEYLRFKSMGKWFWQMLYIYEKFAYRSAHMVFFLSENDRQKAIYEFDLKPERTLLAPYGVSHLTQPQPSPAAAIISLRTELGIQSHERFILFFSTLSYGPNEDAVKYIINEIYPRLIQKGFPFKLVICGKGLNSTLQEQINQKPEMMYCGFVDDINLYIDAADVMLNPILSGGGVKTKAIDSLARNQRVISTQNGALGIDPQVCGNNLVITTDYQWDAFVEAIVDYSSEPKTIPQTFYDTYGWKNIAQAITGAMAKLR